MIRKLFIFFLKLGVLCSTLIALFIGTVLVGGFGPIPSYRELTEIKQAEASIIYSADQDIIGKIYYENRTQTSYDKIPKYLIEALVATEDVRFYDHNGIDKIALLRVLFKTIILGNNSSGGGSTLSQQLAKNLFHRKNFAFLSMPVNKTKEAILANRLETIYSKKEILTLYLNTVPFGEGVYGIESASERYFSIPVNKLSLTQSAVLIGMLKANSYYNPRKHPDHAKTRRNVVLGQMHRAGFISDKTLITACKSPLNTKYTNLVLKNPNGYFLQQIKSKTKNILSDLHKENGTKWSAEYDGLIIETTLNLELQNAALIAQKKHLTKLQSSMDIYWKTLKKTQKTQSIIEKDWESTKDYKRYKKLKINHNSIIDSAKKKEKRFLFDWKSSSQNISKIDSIQHYLKMIHAAVYAVDVTTGAIQIYIGGNNYEYLPYNLIRSERQAASVFKPFVYTAALENGQKPCDWIDNEVKTYTDYENWKPENYDHSSGGYYSMPGALARSMNIPTIETYLKVGNRSLQSTVDAMGLTKRLKDVPATALGSTTYSLQDLVHAYIPFATRKNTVNPYFISCIKTAKGKILYEHKTQGKQENTKQAIEPKTLETMQYLLKGVVENGTARALTQQYKAKGDWAGKTGTSQNYSDSWFIGFNSKIIIGSWVGCSYPSIHLAPGIGGGSVAALPIVAAVASQKYSSQAINNNLSAGFPKFHQSVIDACNCEFYREENTFEKLFDFFDKDEKKTDKKKKKKRGFFSRIFGQKKEKDTIE